MKEKMLSECNFKKTKARRNYKCFICGRTIKKGEYYIAEIAETPNRSFFGGYNPIGPNFYCYARICLNHTKKEYYEHRSKHPRDAFPE